MVSGLNDVIDGLPVLVIRIGIQQLVQAQERVKECAAFFFSLSSLVRIGSDTGAAGWALDEGMINMILFMSLYACINIRPLPCLWDVVWGDTGIRFPKNADGKAFGACNRLEKTGMIIAKIVVPCCP
jgi:hypothetical protein